MAHQVNENFLQYTHRLHGASQPTSWLDAKSDQLAVGLITPPATKSPTLSPMRGCYKWIEHLMDYKTFTSFSSFPPAGRIRQLKEKDVLTA